MLGRAGYRRRLAHALGWLGLGLLAVAPTSQALADDADTVLLEFHFQPVPNLQIAIWLERPDGTFVDDVFVTQATGKLGIGNRAGRWDFLSSWRFPYGPRPQVAPVWAHRRGKTYPSITFHDDDDADQDSLGWHENSSSPENYYCRPLTEGEHATISTDSMTCPSPATFQSDKGRFHPSKTRLYPPRNDLIEFEEVHDHADVMMYSALNDMDSFTGATPVGGQPEMIPFTLSEELADDGPLVAWIEVSLEGDENSSYDFDREDDHFVDPRLSAYGIAYFGQPSVVYRVEFEPMEEAFRGTSEYVGHGEWDGTSGELHPPSSSISQSGGSGADRLQLYTKNNETFRFGVFSHGPGTGGDDGGDGGGDDGGDDGGGDDGDDGGGWGGDCSPGPLPAVEELELEPLAFDSIRIKFRVPELEGGTIEKLQVLYLTGETALTEKNSGSALEPMGSALDCQPLVPGEDAYCDLRQLFGNYTYQIGVRYEDGCSNRSGLVTDETTTPVQKFAQVDSFCFIATAAYGGGWMKEVRALRWFRDAYLKKIPLGAELVRFYYTYSPPLADAIRGRPLARAMVRTVLQPVADLARVSTGS